MQGRDGGDESLVMVFMPVVVVHHVYYKPIISIPDMGYN